MSLSLALPLLAAAALSPEDTRRVDCVVTLAVVAYEQQRGAAPATPGLDAEGARFAQVVGEGLVKGGRSRDEVQQVMLAAASARQKAAKLPDAAQVQTCLSLARQVAPPPPAPGLPQCAAMLGVLADTARAAGKPDKDAETLASVLDNRARTALKGEGRSQTEIDATMTAAKADTAAEAARRAGDGVSAGFDYPACVALAAP